MNARESTTPNHDPELASLRSGDPQALEDFYRLLAPIVLQLARRRGLSDDDAQDVCVDTFLRIYDRLRHELDPVDNIRAYAYRVASLTISDRIRREYKTNRRWAEPQFSLDETIDSIESLQSLIPEPSDPLEAVEQSEVVAQAISQLSSMDRNLVIQYLLEEEPMLGIAKTLGISENAAQLRLRKILQRLRQQVRTAMDRS